MIFGRKQTNEVNVTMGATYQRMTASRSLETARVLAVNRDGVGIPHVRYHFHIDRPDGYTADETRTLALASFAEMFREQVYA